MNTDKILQLIANNERQRMNAQMQQSRERNRHAALGVGINMALLHHNYLMLSMAYQGLNEDQTK